MEGHVIEVICGRLVIANFKATEENVTDRDDRRVIK